MIDEAVKCNVIVQNKFVTSICSVSFIGTVQLFVYATHKKRASTPARDTVRAAPAENSDIAPFMPSSPEIIAVCTQNNITYNNQTN